MQLQDDSQIMNLRTLYSDLSNAVLQNNKRYFHLNTIGNLIYHFEEIENQRDRTWVYESLVEYFKKCADLVPSIDRKTSQFIFHEYLSRIAEFYDDKLGFVLLINRWVFYLVYAVVILVFYIFFKFYFAVFIAIIFVIQIFRVFKKYRERRCYSLFW
jgi:hypothetical protein